MKSRLVLIIFLILISTITFSLDCQYTENSPIVIVKQGIETKDTNTFIENPITFTNFYGGYNIGFTVNNTTNYDLNAKITYTHLSTGGPTYCLGEFPTDSEITISANNSYQVAFNSKCSGSVSEDVKYIVHENELVTESFNKNFNETEEICSTCPNGEVCLNDNVVCSSGNQCGGGYCVENKCSTNANSCVEGNLEPDGTCNLTSGQQMDIVQDTDYINELTEQWIIEHPLTCDYQHQANQIIKSKGVRVKSTNNFIPNPIEFTNFTGGYSQSVVVKNNTDYPIEATISYTNVLTWPNNPVDCPGSFPSNSEVSIPAKQTYSISVPAGACAGDIDQTNISYNIHDNIYLNSSKIENFTISVPECDICMGGKECINNGILCDIGNECGGAFCIENHCSTDEFCFQNNCQCESNELQCPNNKKCVLSNNLPLGAKPICAGEKECITNHIDENGLCAKTLTQIAEEERLAKLAKDAELVKKQKDLEIEQQNFINNLVFFAIIGIVLIVIFFAIIGGLGGGAVYESVTFWRRIR